MSNVETLKLPESSYKQLYDRQREEIEYLKEFIGKASVEKINSLEALSTENEVLKAKLVEKNKQLADKDKAYSDYKSSTEKRIKQAVESAERRKDYEYAEKLNNKGLNERRSIRNNEVKPEKQRADLAEKERDRVKEMYDSLLSEFKLSHQNESTIIGLCQEILSAVKSNLEKGNTVDDMIKIIDNGIESITNTSIADECRRIHELKSAGITHSEIASIVYPGLKRGVTKVSERINSKIYEEMFYKP